MSSPAISVNPCVCVYHRHGIDKYLDTLLADQPISDGEATDHCQKGAPQDGGLPELIVAGSPILPNQSQRSKSSVIGYAPKQNVSEITNAVIDVSSAVTWNT